MKPLRQACVAIALVLSSRFVQAQHIVTVDPTEPRQTLEGWGISLAWFANSAGGWPDDQRERMAKALFDRDTGLGLNWIRYNIGGGDNPAYAKPISRPENAVPGYLNASGKYDWTRDAKQRWMMKRAQALGANLFEAISFSPPYWMTASGTSQGADDGGSNLQRKFFGQQKGSFVDYLAEVVQHAAKDWGVTFRTVDPLNEPIPTWWKAGDQKQEGAHFSQEEQGRLISDLGAVLARDTSMTTIAAPDENNIDNTIKEVRSYSADALARVTQINTHSYAGSERVALRDLAATRGKRLTMSEWGSSPDISGKDLATQIQADVADMGVVDWAIWQPDWPGIMRVNYRTSQFSLTPMYWVYAAFTRFLKPGYQIMPTHDRSALAAYSAKDRTLVMVQQNWSQQDDRVTFNLSGFRGASVEVLGFRAHGNESLEALDKHRLTGPVFTVVLPAGSVTTYVISGVSTYAATQAYAASAASRKVFQSARTNEVGTLPFEGRQAMVFGSFAPNAGMAAISVDGGAETYVDLYAVERKDNVPLYSTSLLAAGRHVLRVRVSGLKAGESAGAEVTVSRVAAPPLPRVLDNKQLGTGPDKVDFHGKWTLARTAAAGAASAFYVSDAADDTFTLHFNGRGARFFTVLGPDRGMAAFSLDGGAETVMDLYSPLLRPGAFFYESPPTDAGTHVLKVRVLQRHDTLSSGNGVAVDHVEVLQ